eukprot:Gb_21381 [translate_table: standard]
MPVQVGRVSMKGLGHTVYNCGAVLLMAGLVFFIYFFSECTSTTIQTSKPKIQSCSTREKIKCGTKLLLRIALSPGNVSYPFLLSFS